MLWWGVMVCICSTVPFWLLLLLLLFMIIKKAEHHHPHHNMFYLSFFNVVSKIMTWSVITPPTHFVNTHEFKIEKRTNRQSSKKFMDSLKTMSPEFIQLHAYVHSTYPFYFGLGCQEGFLQPKDSHTVYACNTWDILRFMMMMVMIFFFLVFSSSSHINDDDGRRRRENENEIKEWKNWVFLCGIMMMILLLLLLLLPTYYYYCRFLKSRSK